MKQMVSAMQLQCTSCIKAINITKSSTTQDTQVAFTKVDDSCCT